MTDKLSIQQFNSLLEQKESEKLEFKEAKDNFSISKLGDYCAAMANEGGGNLLLGVNDSGVPVGTSLFKGTENTSSHKIYQSIKHRVNVDEVIITESGKRVLLFSIPPRPTGRPISSNGKYRYPMRLGESIIEMDSTTLASIFQEISPDKSAEIIPNTSIDDLSPTYIQSFKGMWAEKSDRKEHLSLEDNKALLTLNLTNDDGECSCAALLLFGTEKALTKYLPDSEIIFEWRDDPKTTNYTYRKVWRNGFIGTFDEIWQTLDVRNARRPFQDGFIQKEIIAFDEKVFREALLNAFTHRDYLLKGHSIFIKANPNFYTVESPGSLIGGVSLQNILRKTAWRNRLLAESLEKTGLVERSGQGIDDIFEISIRNGKGSPKMEEPYSNSFKITIPAKIKDVDFIKYLYLISKEKSIGLSVEEVVELENIRENAPVKISADFKDKFLEYGLVDKIGHGRSAKFILSHNYYESKNLKGLYTKLSGIPREEKKALVIQHLKKNKTATRSEFEDIFKDIAPQDISNLLRELKNEGKIIFSGDNAKKGSWVLK